MSFATASAPYLILAFVQLWLATVQHRSSLSQSCKVASRYSILVAAQLLWAVATLHSALYVLMPQLSGVGAARDWLLISVPLLLLTYILLLANLATTVKILFLLSLPAVYALLLFSLIAVGAGDPWSWLFMAPLVLSLCLRTRLTPLLRDRASWIGISVLPALVILPLAARPLYGVLVAACGVVAGFLWWWSSTQIRSGYGLLLPAARTRAVVAPAMGGLTNTGLLLERIGTLLAAPVAVVSRHKYIAPQLSDEDQKICSINPAALELCRKRIWVDDAVSVSHLLHQEMLSSNIAAIVPLQGWSHSKIGGWLVLGMPMKPVVIDRRQLDEQYFQLNAVFRQQDAGDASVYLDNLSEITRLGSEAGHISTRLSTVAAGESSHLIDDLRQYGDRLIADGVRRFTAIATERRFAVTYLGSDRELIWSLRKKIPLLRYMVSVNSVGDDNDVIIIDVESIKTNELDAFIGWLVASRPLRVVVVGHREPDRLGRSDAISAFSRHTVSYVRTRVASDICAVVSPYPDKYNVYAAKNKGYAMEQEVKYLERDLALRAVELTHGKVTKAADLLGTAPSTFARRLRHLVQLSNDRTLEDGG